MSTAATQRSNLMIADKFKPNGLRPQPFKFILNPTVVIMTVVIFVLTIALGVVVVTSSSLGECQNKTDVTDEDSDNIGDDKHLRIVTRNDWLAEPASEPLDKLQLPVHRIIILHTATEGCASQATCATTTKSIQHFYKYSLHFFDIAHNFLIGGDGNVYEGRGWDDRGAHTMGYNADSIGIGFIGTFNQNTPPEKQLNAAKLLIDEGVRLKKIAIDYRLYGARQLRATESPGEALFEEIKTWPQWSNVV